MGHPMEAVAHGRHNGESRGGNPDLILSCSLGLLLVPLTVQTQPETRVQGTPVRGPRGSVSWALSRVEKDGSDLEGKLKMSIIMRLYNFYNYGKSHK